MTDTSRPIRRGRTAGLPAAMACASLIMASDGARAQDWPPESAFGCARLDTVQPAPVIEGRDGMFFRLSDMRMNHPLSDASVAWMAAFARALAAHGTTLVFVPLPTKSLVLPDHLPATAADYGFDFDIASMVYADFVARLRDAGIVTVDAQTPLLDLDGPELPFMRTDFHWSAAGARAAADAVGAAIRDHPAHAALDPAPQMTTALGVQPVASSFRAAIQMRCREHIPPAETEAYETRPADTGLSGGGGIFAADAGRPGIVLVGTSMSQTPQFNFDGFLAEAAQLDVTSYAVTGGNQFGSMVSYMMSGDFRENPPHFLVWENPVYNNLGEFGGIPLRELIAAATDRCTPIDSHIGADGALVASSLQGPFAEGEFLRADTGGGGAYQARFAVETPDALARRTIDRTPRADPTRLFYLPLDQFDTVAGVTVRFDRRTGPDASLALCSDERTSG